MNQRHKDLQAKRLELQNKLEEMTRSIRAELNDIEVELRNYIECHCEGKIHSYYDELTLQRCYDDCEGCRVWYCPDCIHEMEHTFHRCFNDR